MAVHGQAVSDVLFAHLKEFQLFANIGEILLGLRKKNVIEDDEYLEVIDESKKKQARFLIEKIPRGGDNAFKALLESIFEKDKPFAEKLLKSLEQHESTSASSFARKLRKDLKWANAEGEESEEELPPNETSSTSKAPKKRLKKDAASEGASNSRAKDGPPPRKRRAKRDDASVSKPNDSRSSGKRDSIASVGRMKGLRKILSDSNTIIDMDDFLQELSQEELIALPQEQDIRRKDNYSDKMNEIFGILHRKKNPKTTCEKLLHVLQAMERDDIIDRWDDEA